MPSVFVSSLSESCHGRELIELRCRLRALVLASFPLYLTRCPLAKRRNKPAFLATTRRTAEIMSLSAAIVVARTHVSSSSAQQGMKPMRPLSRAPCCFFSLQKIVQHIFKS